MGPRRHPPAERPSETSEYSATIIRELFWLKYVRVSCCSRHTEHDKGTQHYCRYFARNTRLLEDA